MHESYGRPAAVPDGRWGYARPDQVPDDFTAASIMAELDVIDGHVHAVATSDPAITADTLDPYARTYRALGGELTGVAAADADDRR